MLINIHNHQASAANEITIRNIHHRFTDLLPAEYFSAQHSKFIAIGECVLDKSFDCDIKLQKKVLAEQIKLTIRVDKLLIISKNTI